MKSNSVRTLVGIGVLSIFSAVYAQQDAGVVMKEGSVSESALIDALKPEIKTRSLKVERTAAATPPKPAAASLLITFETNSAELTPKAKESLAVVGKALNADELSSFAFQIEGHADPRGAHDMNQKLSEARAQSVRQYLVSAHNIEEARLKAVGKGDRSLLRPDDPSAPENRRVTIKTITE